MMTRSIAILLTATLGLSACGDSSLNPFRWFGGGRRAGPTTLEPDGGYAIGDRRQSFPHLLAARWEDVPEGRMLVVSGVAPTKGWWDVALVTEEVMPAGRLRAGPDGILRLRMVGSPPLPDQPEARMQADPRVDTITTALTITTPQLARLRGIVISGASNSLSVSR
ncbi:hypothetical protein DRW48_06790 [Paracoccus suum]|uniref:Uncharacterized protein n=1 Tax=Paracoccus suum TaxID=2259340 RepID=A0A344PJ78_9RHOB|nr:hypothetical protein [Paracoccus suum]AXC49433.1 hypothetical protein DRW48_06790 [Paracoccus suum]